MKLVNGSPRRVGEREGELLRESLIERYLVRRVEQAGGMCFKWVSPSNSGVPDRIVLLDRQVCFVELKAPGKKPRPLQEYTLNKLAEAGYSTYVIDSKEEVDNLVKLMTVDRWMIG